ncbi:MAG: nucleotide exchange factor GrpE [Coriobacteriia bacterium]|nr:nucleotide exchange factor GrpE [Coriobacteriia bacterium]
MDRRNNYGFYRPWPDRYGFYAQNRSNSQESSESNDEREDEDASQAVADDTDICGEDMSSSPEEDTADDAAEEAFADEDKEAADGTEDGLLDDIEQAGLLDIALSELAQVQERYMRLQAEWDNYRKRTAKERDEERERAAAHLVERLLPIIDDLERAVEFSENASTDSLAEGVKAVLAKLSDLLAYEGLQVVDPVGEAFDLNLHQAIARVDDDSVADETVVQVYQKGYIMGGRVLRNAVVVVAAGGPQREARREAVDPNKGPRDEGLDGQAGDEDETGPSERPGQASQPGPDQRTDQADD